MTAADTASELVVVEQSSAIVIADPSAVVEAFANYQEIQKALDRAMPNCIMQIQGKSFRKKQYWRAIATAFNLHLECVSEERDIIEGKPISHHVPEDDWGYRVIYRATASNGRSCDGDGSCYASEKLTRDGRPSAMMGEHNIRAHAHTRAKNRAIADLVGFGEVSAEEINRAEPAPRARQASGSRGKKAADSNALTDGDTKLLNVAATEAAERLLDTAAENEIAAAPQSEDAMFQALKEAVFIHCGSKPAKHDNVNEFEAAFGLAVIELDGKITFANREAA